MAGGTTPVGCEPSGALALSDLFTRRRKDDAEAAPAAQDGPIHPTKALARFLTSLAAREQPRLLDLGPVVGQNVNFFGEELGCKIFVEDIFKDIDRSVQEGRVEQLADLFKSRFPQESDSVDGILCWDLFDYLDKGAAQTLAGQMARILRPEGVLLAMFATSEIKTAGQPTYTRHVVVDRTSLQGRPYPAARAKQRPLLNRDIQRMFEPLRISDQFLLKTNMREVLFRK